MRPGVAPPMFWMMRLSVRPTVALARDPGPKTFVEWLNPSSRATGPPTTNSGDAGWFEVRTPKRLNSSRHMALTPASTTGM